LGGTGRREMKKKKPPPGRCEAFSKKGRGIVTTGGTPVSLGLGDDVLNIPRVGNKACPRDFSHSNLILSSVYSIRTPTRFLHAHRFPNRGKAGKGRRCGMPVNKKTE